MASALRLLSIILLCFLFLHFTLSAPQRRRTRGRVKEENWIQQMKEEEKGSNIMETLINFVRDQLTSRNKGNCGGRRCYSGTNAQEEEPVIIALEKRKRNHDISVLFSILYDDEAPWGPCTRSCTTKRVRSD
ncbi:uncharacterized protein LOC121863752 [Homarus americanus]|uniref:uncharacterized protein LOC121863752 n=1 Tax=Homarus americanus TaxID=6706 RepID=UPI001C43ACD8|nr:uncharacterized protein LOC121863752 [Homarus americanus]